MPARHPIKMFPARMEKIMSDRQSYLKKYLVSLVVLGFILGLAACGGGGGSSNNSQPSTALTWDQGNWDQKNWQ